MLNAISFGGNKTRFVFHSKLQKAKNYLNPTALQAAGTIHKFNNAYPLVKAKKTTEDNPTSWYQRKNALAYSTAIKTGLVGYSIGSAVSLGSEKIGDEICYHSKRTPLMLFAYNNVGELVEKSIDSKYLSQDSATAVVGVLTPAAYLLLDAMITPGLTYVGEKLGFIESEEQE
jgi:hypothetical protein